MSKLLAKLLDDPVMAMAFVKVLIGIVVVLTIAVIVLAIKKNRVIYVDAEGNQYDRQPQKKKGNSAPVAGSELTAKEGDVAAVAAVSAINAIRPDEAPLPEDDLGILNVEREEDESATKVVPSMHDTVASAPVALEDVVEERPGSQVISGLSVTVTVAGQSTQYNIRNFPCLMGRETDKCDIVISEPAVSRRHARFLLEGGEIYIEDVSEHNGTFLNEMKLPPLGRARVHEGDVVTLGRARIRANSYLYD